MAQCAQWSPADGYPGVAGPNASRLPVDVTGLVTWDQDAGGPLPPVLVVRGNFNVAGAVFVADRAAYAPDTGAWSPLAANPHLVGVTAQTTLPNGDEVFARGSTIERWDGVAWTSLGAGMNGTIRALAALPTGDIVAGGDFTTADGVAANRVAVWGGTVWAPLGTGMDGAVRALLVSGGAVVAGGSFGTAGGVAANHIAIWDGLSWSALDTGTDDDVHALAILSSGELAVAGAFTTAGPFSALRVARWDGVTWAALDSGVNDTVRRLFRPPGGDLIAYGDFDLAGGVSVNGLARWDGTAWATLGPSAVEPLHVAMLANGDIVAGGTNGYFPGYGLAGDGVALQRWDGSVWRPVGPGMDREVRALCMAADGSVFAGGSFTQAGAAIAQRIARFDGVAWSPLGCGVDGVVRALAELPGGDLIVGGDFAMAGGAAAASIASWDGALWSPLGAGTDGVVRALATLPNGDVFAGGEFSNAGLVAASRIARWDGSAWLPLGNGMNGTVRALAVLANGDLVAAGDFTTADGVAAARIASWDGAAWSPLGTGLDATVQSLHVLGNGDLIAGGQFTMAGGVAASQIARWDGVAWSSLDSPLLEFGEGVAALATMPDGDLIATSYSFGVWEPGQPASRVLRWDGATWTQLGTTNGRVHALARRDGELTVGGAFTAADGDVSAFFARLVSTCPATATVAGLGCTSSGGDNTLTATTLPWVDTTFRATATGLPGMCFALALTGFTPVPQGALPLSSIFAEGGVGCDVLVDPLILQLLLPDAGVAESELFLLSTPPLVGLTFRHQMIPFEVDGSGGFVAITATNALDLLAGDF